MTCRTQPDQRRAELARIHIVAADLGMDRGAYEQMLFPLARVRSAADLDHAGRRAVLDHLRALSGPPAAPPRRRSAYPGRPHNIDSADRGPLIKKIEAYLAAAHRPWSYADSMARRICKRDRVALCEPAQLRKLVAALEYDARRRAKPPEALRP